MLNFLPKRASVVFRRTVRLNNVNAVRSKRNARAGAERHLI